MLAGISDQYFLDVVRTAEEVAAEGDETVTDNVAECQ
jgi:hypothetical protein